MEKFPGHFLVESSKVDFMTILYTHEAIPWSDSMDLVYVENFPGNVPTESKSVGVIMSTNIQDLFPEIPKILNFNHSSSQLMTFQISSTKIDQKFVPDPMG